MKNKGSLYVLTCYVIWGLLPIFWKLLAQVDSLYVLASRIVWSMVLTGGILLLRRDRLAGVRAAFRDRREWGLLAAAGCVVCVNWGVYIWAVANGHMIDQDSARVRRQQAVYQLQHGGLSAAGPADDRHKCARLHIQREVPQNGLGAEGLGDAFKANDRLGHITPPAGPSGAGSPWPHPARSGPPPPPGS